VIEVVPAKDPSAKKVVADVISARDVRVAVTTSTERAAWNVERARWRRAVPLACLDDCGADEWEPEAKITTTPIKTPTTSPRRAPAPATW
jgi:hypothetical protein